MIHHRFNVAGFRCFNRLVATLALATLIPETVIAQPVADVERQLQQEVAEASAALQTDPDDIQTLLRRGDAHFFLGRFDEAIIDYDRMIALRPSLAPTHWQRGLALYFAGKYEEAAKQFEKYYELDKSDRENGIWRFYAQVKQVGVEKARKQLLSYSAPDRAPLPAIYELCAGKLDPDQVLSTVDEEGLSALERSKRQFYATLYLGLDASLVKQDQVQAKQFLSQTLENSWPKNSGYGPTFMWHVARLSLKQIDGRKGKP